MYTKPWIPRADEAFRSFVNSFCMSISADPPRYMMTVAEAASLMQGLQRFKEACTFAKEPRTRTKITIADKDNARSILQDKIETYGAFIRINKGIIDGDKLAIGVRPRNIAHTRRTAPTTSPLLNFIGSLPGMDQLVYHDSNTPDSSAKPRNAERLELWVAYAQPGADQPRPKRKDAHLVKSYKKSKMIVEQDPDRDVRMGGTGKPTYWARWIGYDGSAGPWSLACNISGGSSAKVKQNDQQRTSESDDDQSLKIAA